MKVSKTNRMRARSKTTLPQPNTTIARPICPHILPILIISDSIMTSLNPISGVEIVAIPGLSASTLMFNLMQPGFLTWLRLEGRRSVVVHVGTNDLFSHDITSVTSYIIHAIYILISAGPFLVYSSILPRLRDHVNSDPFRRIVNNSVMDHFESQHMYVPVWRTYRNFLQNNSPRANLFNHRRQHSP